MIINIRLLCLKTHWRHINRHCCDNDDYYFSMHVWINILEPHVHTEFGLKTFSRSLCQQTTSSKPFHKRQIIAWHIAFMSTILRMMQLNFLDGCISEEIKKVKVFATIIVITLPIYHTPRIQIKSHIRSQLLVSKTQCVFLFVYYETYDISHTHTHYKHLSSHFFVRHSHFMSSRQMYDHRQLYLTFECLIDLVCVCMCSL